MSDTARRLSLPTAAALLGLLLAGCGGNDAFELRGRTMGTGFTVTLADPVDAGQRAAIAGDIDATLEHMIDVFSTYEDHSEVSRFNAARESRWETVSSDFAAVLTVAIDVGKLTDGALDVTVGPAVDLWGFGPGAPVTEPPSAATLAELTPITGQDLLEYRTVDRSLRKRHAGVAIDFSALAKGYAVDRVAAVLDEHGMANYLVNIGGEIRTRGCNPDGAAWKIAVETPGITPASAQRVLALSGKAVATSGHHRNAFTHNETRYSHILDPRTLRPVHHAAASVTVVHRDAAVADALATALLVLGPEQGMRLANDFAWPVLMLVGTEDGFEERSTSQMRDLYADGTAAN